MADADLYTLTSDTVETPPHALGAALKRIGPGMVLAASIVGSGELIATTTLGAQVGYLALWIIVLSCVIKPVVQGELGRYTIATGETDSLLAELAQSRDQRLVDTARQHHQGSIAGLGVSDAQPVDKLTLLAQSRQRLG